MYELMLPSRTPLSFISSSFSFVWESRTTSKERWEISHPRKVEANLPDLAGIIVETTSTVDDPQTCTHYATDIYDYLRSLEFSSQLLEFLGSYLGELSLIDYDLQLNEKAIRWKTTRIQYKQPQMPAGGAHTEADVAPSWENQHRKAF
ncbi:unnamed protein product [Musa hybrid cultivar]